MKTFREFLVNESTKVQSGGNGYWESFSEGPKAESILAALVKEVKMFISASEDYADDEGISVKKQKELIIDDIVSNLYTKFGGK